MLQRILVTTPHDDWAWYLYAEVQTDLGEIKIARQAQARAHELNPELKFKNFDRATVHSLLRQGHYNSAHEYFPAVRAEAVKTHSLMSIDLKKYHMADAKHRSTKRSLAKR